MEGSSTLNKTFAHALGLPLLGLMVLTGCPNEEPVSASNGTESGGSTGGESSDTAVTDTNPATTGIDPSTGSTTRPGDTSGEETGTVPECGNGVVDADEDCDDGGESTTCNADCTMASCGDGVLNETAGEACDDAGESDACNDDCTAATCGDGVLNETAGEACDDGGRTEACNDDCTLASCGDGVVNGAAGEDCDDAGESATCNDDCTTATCGDGLLNETAGEVCDDGGESATCNVDCTTASCGDGVFNETAGEECDGAGRSASCNADCTNASCGDGIVNATAGEACDDAGESATCNSDCSAASCGDGVTNTTAGEACDDAGESAACNADCTAATCGDGIINATAGEDCDDSGESATCNADCTTATCGDGIINAAAGETCDDAGESATCNTDCTAAACGDGIVNTTAGETCDDGGESATCDTDCTPAECGDGIVNAAAGETCDDGNTGTECLPGCVPCPPTVIFEEDFSDNLAGWTLGTDWQIGPAQASTGHSTSCGNGDPATDHTPTADNGLAGANIGGNITTAVHPFYYLTSPSIDTAGFSTLTLDLWRWLNSDYTPYMQNHIEVWDGAAWQVVFASGPSPGIEDAEWTNVTYDISAYANAAMQIRIGYNVDSGGAFTCSGWNVDDISIYSNDCNAGACSGGADQVSANPNGTQVLCDDPTDTTCEQDFESLCPAGWGLCTQLQHNNRNDGWDEPVGPGASAALGEIYCRAGGSAGHLSVGPYDGITNLNQDMPLNCGYGSSRAACPSAFGCNETTSRALCCAPTPTCGNGVVDSVEEECDDGNSDETDACLNSCSWRVPTANGLSGLGC